MHGWPFCRELSAVAAPFLRAGRGGQILGRNTELLSAMRTIAQTGQGPKIQLPSMGCSIKWSD